MREGLDDVAVMVGARDGRRVGCEVIAMEGTAVGSKEGIGEVVGEMIGVAVGSFVGLFVV